MGLVRQPHPIVMTSKKDYVRTAAAIRKVLTDHASDEARAAIKDLGHRLAHQFGEDNPRFDNQRFLVASGLTEG